MDAAGIDMQIVSLAAPGVEQLEAAEAIAGIDAGRGQPKRGHVGVIAKTDYGRLQIIPNTNRY